MADPISLTRSAAALRYLLSLDQIEGWLSTDTALAMIELGWEQARRGMSSGMAEIGVHHGKSFLALAASAQPNEPVIAIDVFERQDLNVDYSGCGNRDQFLANVGRFFKGVEPRLIAGSSADLRGHEAAQGLSGLRFISIDGGHTAALTLNDLQIADVALAPAGLCALDDVLNAHWTGVVTGLFEYFATGGALVPFCLVPNKLLLCRPQHVESYAAFMRATFPYALDRQALEFGPGRIDVYGAMWSPLNQTVSDLLAFARMGSAPAMQAPGAPQIAVAAQDLGVAAGLTLDLAREQQARREAETRLQQTLASRSWRFTGPVRTVVRIARAGLGGVPSHP